MGASLKIQTLGMGVMQQQSAPGLRPGVMVIAGDVLWGSVFRPLNPAVYLVDTAATGLKLSDLLGLGASQVDTQYRSSAPYNVAVLWGGVNDLLAIGGTAAGLYADTTTWCLARRGAGWKVVVCTLPKYSGLLELSRTTYNGLLASDLSFADALADVATAAQDPTAQPSWWNGDQRTLTTAGLQVVCGTIATAVRGVI